MSYAAMCMDGLIFESTGCIVLQRIYEWSVLSLDISLRDLL